MARGELLNSFLKEIAHQLKLSSVVNLHDAINRLTRRRWLLNCKSRRLEVKDNFLFFWGVVNYCSSHFWRSFAQLTWLFLCNRPDPRLFVTQLADCSADRSGIATLPRWGHGENTFGKAIKSSTGGTAWTLLFSNAGHLKSSYSTHFLIFIFPPQCPVEQPFEEKKKKIIPETRKPPAVQICSVLDPSKRRGIKTRVWVPSVASLRTYFQNYTLNPIPPEKQKSKKKEKLLFSFGFFFYLECNKDVELNATISIFYFSTLSEGDNDLNQFPLIGVILFCEGVRCVLSPPCVSPVVLFKYSGFSLAVWCK